MNEVNQNNSEVNKNLETKDENLDLYFPDPYSHKRVLVIFTGGTVAGNVAESTVNQKINSKPNDFKKILDESIKIIRENWGIEIFATIKELINEDSSNILPEHWSLMIDAITNSYDDFDAFIVLHGTNTMGYSSAALSFGLQNINKPVIFTGAQVPLGYLGSDAITNLVNSLRLSVWAYHDVKGVMAVFGSKIITGARVKKGTEFDYDPFSSFQTGALGTIGRFMRIDEGALQKHNSYLSRKFPLAVQAKGLKVENNFVTENIASFTEFPGMKPDLFKSLVQEQGVKAFVFRAFGAGDPNKKLFPAFEYLKKQKIPIVVTTQAPGGVSNFLVNETGQYLAENQLAIPAHDMSIESMTVKMGWLLGQNFSYDDINRIMVEDLHGEINISTELI